MNPKTPYRFYEIWVPKRPTYSEDNPHRWPALIGNFILPIVFDKPELLYWFVQEGPWFQFCFATDDAVLMKNTEKKIRQVCKERKFRTKKIIRDTLGSALGGPRWVEKEKIGTDREAFRSFLMVQSCSAVCRLYLDSLKFDEKTGWTTELNDDERQNPHKSFFESFMHLIANITEAQFDLNIDVRTNWMPYRRMKVPCHL